MKKEYIITISAVAILGIGLTGYAMLKNQNKSIENEQTVQIDKYKDIELPNFNTINEKTEPLMYDYQNSLMNNAFSGRKDGITYRGAQIYVFSDKMKYVYEEDFLNKDVGGTTPDFGTKPFRTNFSIDQFKKIANEMPKKFPDKQNVFKENGYTFIFVDNEDDQQAFMMSHGVNYDMEKSSNKSTDGRFYEKYISTGLGWPSEILRKEKYAKSLKEAGVDIYNSWWDTHNYQSITLYKDEDGEIYRVTNPTENKISFMYPDGTVYSFIREPGKPEPQEQLKQFMSGINKKLKAVDPQDFQKEMKKSTSEN